jgi:hypothetical protein
MSIIRNGILSADLDVPVVLPTLNLDFANSQSLDKRITFSRGSIGTRVNRNGLIETIPANQPRFDFDPISGECRGLLIEEQRTNSSPNSDAITTSNLYGFSNSTLTQVTTTTPISGLAIATKVFLNVGANVGNSQNGFNFGAFSITNSTVYTQSIFVKASGSSVFRLRSNVTGQVFDIPIAGPAPTPTGTITSCSVTPYPDSWSRISWTFTSTTSTPGNRGDHWAMKPNIADGSSGFLVTGAQLEAGAFPTSYIPTTASTVTRSADNASMTGTNFSSWYNQSEGTVFCSFKTDGISGGPRTFQLTGNNQNERLDHRLVTNTNGSEYYTGGINFGRISDSGVTNPSQGKITVSQNSRSRQFCMNGRTVSSATIPNAPAVNTLNIGSYNLQATYLNGTISRLTYYPRALSPAQLQYLTQ